MKKDGAKKKPKLTKLEHDLLEKIGELTDDLQRAQADFANFKRRSEEEKLRSVRFGRETAIMGLLPVIDNVERAIDHVTDAKSKKGMEQISKQLAEALKAIGVERMITKGEEFNPEIHDAVGAEGEGDKEIISEELQSGYSLDGEVIRHAMVRVKRSK